MGTERDRAGDVGGASEQSGSAGSAPTGVHSRVARRYGGAAAGGPAGQPTMDDVATAAVDGKDAGRAVDAGVAAEVGGRLGADFGGVRVHDGADAALASRALGARAFAHGGDVFLGAGESDRDLGLMAHELTHVAQQDGAGARTSQRKVEVGAENSPAEREADQVAAATTRGDRPGNLIVDEGPVGSQQMLKSTFIGLLRPLVVAAAAEELGPMYSVIGCPYIEQYFDRYAGRPATSGEGMLNRWVPATRRTSSAADMIPLVVERVRAGVRTWRDTGEPPADLAAAEPDAATAARAAAGGDVAQPLRPPGGESLASLEAELGDGQPASSQLSPAMAAVIGSPAAEVRVHTGPVAARKAADRDATAFAVGDQVVLGADAPPAGTLEADALLAHELAHTVQQRSAAADPVARRKPIGSGADVAEEAADADAAEALVAAHDPSKRGSLARFGDRITSGLQLQRCDGDKKAEDKKEEAPTWTRPSPRGPATPKPELHTERFGGDKKLDEIAAGTATAKTGEEGLHVRKAQQALVDLGMLGADKVTGKLDADTEAALKTFQGKAKIPVTGALDAATLDALKKGFDDMSRYREIAADPDIEKDVTSGTRALTDEDRKAIEGTLDPQVETEVVVDPTTGKTTTKIKEPTFVDKVEGKTFEKRLRDYLDGRITAQYNYYGKGKAEDRKDPKKMFGWDALEALGGEAKREVETVFGGYAKGPNPDVKRGTVLMDRWEVEEDRIGKADAAGKHKTARWRIQKIMNEDQGFKDLLKKHGALSTRDPEKTTIETVHDSLATSREAELLEIHKGWGGAQGGGKIYLQRYRGGDDMADRLKLWSLFQTVIHEYMHSLTHKKYSDYAKALGDPSGHTLREGVTDFFTKVVWSGVSIDDALRNKIEGDLYDSANPVKIPSLGTYDETAQAEQLASIVGFRNLAAAYFQGKVELIGKK